MPKGSPELVRARKEEIIAACEKLYRTRSFNEITIQDIGRETTLGRTSIYTYFRTKEEIFLAVLQKEYDAWIAELESLLADNDILTKSRFASSLAKTLEKRELLLKIMSMNHFDMEKNSRAECLAAFKAVYGRSMHTVIQCLEKFCPDMDPTEQQRFIYAFFPFIYGIYPYTSVTEKQKKAMEEAGVHYVYHSVYEITFSFLKKWLEVTNE